MSERMDFERARIVSDLVIGDDQGCGILPVMQAGFACEPRPDALRALEELVEDWEHARASETAEKVRADKAEALLKDALNALREWQAAWGMPIVQADALGRIRANAATETVLALAEQQGFSNT